MSVPVKYPWARWEVLLAVAALSDLEYQHRVWIRHELPHEDYYDSLTLSIHTLFDDWAVLPEPQKAVGTVLVDGPEIPRLQELCDVLDPLITELGDRADEEYLQDERWPAVLDRAKAALSALVLAGPITDTLH